MSFSDKVEGKKDELAGKAKQATGAVTGDADTKAEGQSQESGGKLRQGVEEAKDSLKKTGEGLTGG